MKAFLFPGQGSQTVGMGKTLYEGGDAGAAVFRRADELLGYSLSDIMFNGPEEILKQTEYTQPAIFLHSVALLENLTTTPDMVAGHSLGEFSALYAAKVLGFEDALKLVALRGKLMQKAGEIHPGTMAAIIGMDDDVVDRLCEEAAKIINKPVVPANYNCPGQLVISGDVDAVKKAIDLAKEKGCRLAKLLPVSGAFHSPLMEPAYEVFGEQLDDVKFSDPVCPVYSNYTAEPSADAEKIKENVLYQLINPVRWTETLRNMHDEGAVSFTEVGPGKVLQGLVKRTLRNAEIEGIE